MPENLPASSSPSYLDDKWSQRDFKAGSFAGVTDIPSSEVSREVSLRLTKSFPAKLPNKRVADDIRKVLKEELPELSNLGVSPSLWRVLYLSSFSINDTPDLKRVITEVKDLHKSSPKEAGIAILQKAMVSATGISDVLLGLKVARITSGSRNICRQYLALSETWAAGKIPDLSKPLLDYFEKRSDPTTMIVTLSTIHKAYLKDKVADDYISGLLQYNPNVSGWRMVSSLGNLQQAPGLCAWILNTLNGVTPKVLESDGFWDGLASLADKLKSYPAQLNEALYSLASNLQSIFSKCPFIPAFGLIGEIFWEAGNGRYCLTHNERDSVISKIILSERSQSEREPLLAKLILKCINFSISDESMIPRIIDLGTHPTHKRRVALWLDQFYSGGKESGGWIAKLDSFLRKLEAHSHIVDVVFSTDPDKRYRSHETFNSNRVAQADSVPYRRLLDNSLPPEALEMRREIDEVYLRALQLHYGFGGLLFYARGGLTGEPSLLQQFAYDVGRKVYLVNSKNSESFPGRGVVVDGIDPKLVFAKDREAGAQGKDPFHLWKERTLSFCKDELDDLASTRFVLTRGFIGVCPPDTDKYKLDGNRYMYYVPNEHFGLEEFYSPYGIDVAYLVPNKVFKSELSSTLILWKANSVGVDVPKRTKEVSSSGLSIKRLNEKATRLGLSILDLCGGSTFNAGLCNAYPPKGLYFKWEKSESSTDLWGHGHKYFISFSQKDHFDEKLELYQKLHRAVYRVTKATQNLFDLFLISAAFWDIGFTGTNQDPGSTPIIAPELQGMNRNQSRMLLEAYKHHHDRHNVGLPREKFPVFAFSSILNPMAPPDTAVTLDSFNMVLTVNGQMIELPKDSNGKGEKEQGIWDRYVASSFDGTKGFRPFDRRLFVQ